MEAQQVRNVFSRVLKALQKKETSKEEEKRNGHQEGSLRTLEDLNFDNTFEFFSFLYQFY
jgi:hypothetical protein